MNSNHPSHCNPWRQGLYPLNCPRFRVFITFRVGFSSTSTCYRQRRSVTLSLSPRWNGETWLSRGENRHQDLKKRKESGSMKCFQFLGHTVDGSIIQRLHHLREVVNIPLIIVCRASKTSKVAQVFFHQQYLSQLEVNGLFPGFLQVIILPIESGSVMPQCRSLMWADHAGPSGCYL